MLGIFIICGLYFSLVMLVVLPAHMQHTSLTSAIGLSLLIGLAISLYYFLAKSVVTHRVIKLGNSLLFLFLEIIAIPLSTVYIYYSKFAHQSGSSYVKFSLLAIFLVLADPVMVIRNWIMKFNFIKSDSFLRPIVPNHPSSSMDYILAFVLLLLYYLYLLEAQ